MLERTVIAAAVNRHGVVSRRGFLRTIGAGAGLATLGWQDLLLAAAPELQRQGKSVIVLWMQGGPSQFETFDPKPGSDGCQTKTIATAVPGVQVTDFWPNVAKQMKDITLIRSMTNKEGNHQRATYQLHTGYIPSGTLKHPSFGSLVTSEIAPKNAELPGFVSIQGPSQGSGFLPVAYGPFRVQDPARLPQNAEPLVAEARYQRRLGLLRTVDHHFAAAGAKQEVTDHQALYQQASRLVTSPKLTAFDISKESSAIRAAYGNSPFGQGCLLARRLVEVGVTYVEVQLGNWDTHDNNHDRVRDLSGRCDPAFAALVADLKQRGMLADTLVVWMGEFGRTPRVNPRSGRDHYPRAFTVALAGGGTVGGKVIGKTNDNGTDVAARPVTVNDLFFSFCKCLGMNAHKENQSPVGRPLKIVDGGQLIKELFA